MRTAPSPHQQPQQNRLLAALKPDELERLSGAMQLVPLVVGQSVYRPGEKLQYAYFPTTAIVSLNYVTATGAAAETAGVGNEGMIGVTLFLGGDSLPGSAVVQTAGHACRLDERYLKQEFQRAGSLQTMLLRYARVLMAQMAQTAVCNCHHSLEQRLCRWLLLTLDRCVSHELVMTQELVAGILGVRRESITEATGNLQRAGFINSRRGHISIIDREGLEATACECYGILRKELGQL